LTAAGAPARRPSRLKRASIEMKTGGRRSRENRDGG
jgi:hypothetical protein